MSPLLKPPHAEYATNAAIADIPLGATLAEDYNRQPRFDD